jgi:phosphomethylpyrimidine synthase
MLLILAKGMPGRRFLKWDRDLSRARKNWIWEKQMALAIDPQRARQIRKEKKRRFLIGSCAMCGKYCAMEVVAEYLGNSQN